MSSSPLAGVTDGSLSARWQRRRRIVIPVIGALLVIGAFLQWGPIGLGSGPLAVNIGATQGSIERSQAPVAFTIPLLNSGHSLAVIDELKLVGGTRYAGPRMLRLGVLTSAACGGVWPARASRDRFVIAGCGGPYHGALIGRGIGFSISPGFPAAAEVAAARPGTCWVMTEVLIRYHVGIRHYSATDPYDLALCAKDASAQLTAAMNAADSSG